MKQSFLLFMALCVLSVSAQAQQNRDAIKGAASTANANVGRDAGKLPKDTLKWKKGGDVSVNFSQTHLSPHWAAGGESSLAFSTTANLFANYKKEKVIWENYAFLAYGILKAGDRKAIKNSDQFNVGSRVGYKMAKNWYYTAGFLGKTQFTTGYKYTPKDTTYTSNFLAPAYMFVSLGFDYKPSNRLSISFAPAMGKATFVRSNNPIVLASSGIPKDLIEKDKKARYEFGGGIIFRLNGDYFAKKVTYTSQLELFTNYFEDPLQIVDVIWDFQFRIALTKHVSSGVRLNMIYFDSQKTFVTETVNGVERKVQHGAKLQVKEYFEIGMFYAF